MLSLIYLIAITAEAMTGALAAGRRHMDIFGVTVIAFLTALGGGTVRDIVLGRYPIGWTQHPEYVLLVVAGGIAAVLAARFMRHLNRLFLVLDALGLVAFTIIGCDVALGMGYHPVIVVMAGMITGIAGGILRDVLCNRVPIVFRRELYASVSLLVAILYLGLNALEVPHDWNIAASFAFGLALRMTALWREWQLPVFAYRHDHH
ncbi:trimeric intracellular cation channel family protein [Chromobacterium amazonense]|uniref:Trimeric intracellular cation channel family protein n=1 Tax=Chromobacterium amazonense TaxID=1382803 RepID=A0ABU8UXW2_9NEIS|nr:trimeric intracellular cation channel family protein [Chromobacterium amazonense]MBM2884026.1 trimeric intracellular cation channel family protein [Chromobacterium amazonense]MDQ4541069.1 trimeric intracellular cation channel family protein [Chromobacterium amazonense]